MKSLPILIVLALAAAPALAQDRQTQAPGTQQSSPGGAQQSSEFRDRASEPAAVAPDSPRYYRRHPGKLTKFNTGSAGVPEVQFDVDRREARERAKKAQGG